MHLTMMTVLHFYNLDACHSCMGACCFLLLQEQALQCGQSCAGPTNDLGVFRCVDEGEGAAALVVLPAVWVLICDHWFDVADGEDVVGLQEQNRRALWGASGSPSARSWPRPFACACDVKQDAWHCTLRQQAMELQARAGCTDFQLRRQRGATSQNMPRPGIAHSRNHSCTGTCQ